MISLLDFLFLLGAGVPESGIVDVVASDWMEGKEWWVMDQQEQVSAAGQYF